MEMARHDLPKNLQKSVDELLAKRDAVFVLGKVGELRQKLSPVWRECKDASSQRNLLLLDIALESFSTKRLKEHTDSLENMSGMHLFGTT